MNGNGLVSPSLAFDTRGARDENSQDGAGAERMEQRLWSCSSRVLKVPKQAARNAQNAQKLLKQGATSLKCIFPRGLLVVGGDKR